MMKTKTTWINQNGTLYPITEATYRDGDNDQCVARFPGRIAESEVVDRILLYRSIIHQDIKNGQYPRDLS